MDPTLDYHFYSYGQLLSSTGGLGLLHRHHQDALRHEALPSSPQPNWPDPWMLVQCDQPAVHQRSVGGPGGLPITQPLREVCYHQPQLAARRS